MHQTSLKKQKTKHFITNASPSRTPFSKVDRISTLPTEILHYILSFLPTKLATRTSVISKRFNSLWWSFSAIDLNENDHYMYALRKDLGDGPHTRNMFLDHMKNCYMRHDLKFVEKLEILPIEPINAGEDNNISPWIDSFIFAAIEGGALKEMDLRFPITEEPPLQDLSNIDNFYGSFYVMPQIPLFAWCKSLISLRLEGCSFQEFKTMVLDIKLPDLKNLSIRNCLISDNFVTKLIHGCPELEDLSLKFCLDIEVITFSHSKLKKFIVGCHDSSLAFQIDVPNLQTFKFRGAYWQYALVDPISEVRLKPEHIINAPNLETFCVRYACMDRISIQMALTKFKKLKEMTLSHCCIERVPKFWGDKVEKLVISNCEFGGGGGLLLTMANLPLLRFLTIYSCKGIEWLSIKSTKLEKLILRECIGLEEWVINAPNVSCFCCVELGN